MSIMNDKSGAMNLNVSCAKQVLELLFPLYCVMMTPATIVLVDVNDKFKICGQIDENNFSAFREAIIEIFCLKQTSSTQEYNV